MEGKAQQPQRGVSISPSAMVDNVADWPLRRVVEHLRRKEKEDKTDVELDCRVFHTSGIRLFRPIVDELAAEYDVSRGRMCRWLSYHGLEIARSDRLLGLLSDVHSRIRRIAIERNSYAVAGIQESVSPYTPLEEEGKRTSFYIYNSWVLSGFSSLSEVCGVPVSLVAQIFMLHSAVTCDLPHMANVAGRIRAESDWWDKWVKYRTRVLELAVSLWGSG